MSQFDFRLRFNLADSCRIASEAEKLDLLTTPAGQKIYLASGAGGSAIREHARAAVRGGPFNSEQQAREAAESCKRALLFWAVEERVGIDFGDAKPRSMLTKAGLRMLEERQGGPFRNDAHGIDVFERQENLQFVHLNAAAQVGKNPPRLVSIFAREYARKRRVTEKQALACEIYASSHFDVSQRSRFITLVTAVEALLEPARRPQAVQCVIDDLRTETQRAVADEIVKGSIKGALDKLRFDSIGQAGRALATSLLAGRTYGGKPPGAFFTQCYDFRGKILHAGTPGDNVEVQELANAAEEFVAHLLAASLNSQTQDAQGQPAARRAG